jgi:hypothetical protein
VASAGQPAAAGIAGDDDAGVPGIPVLPDLVPRDAERALARWGLLGGGRHAGVRPGRPVSAGRAAAGAARLEDTGLLQAAREIYGQLENRFYGMGATLLTLVFLALAGEPRPSPAPTTGAGRTSTTWPTRLRSWASARGRARARR